MFHKHGWLISRSLVYFFFSVFFFFFGGGGGGRWVVGDEGNDHYF